MLINLSNNCGMLQDYFDNIRWSPYINLLTYSNYSTLRILHYNILNFSLTSNDHPYNLAYQHDMYYILFHISNYHQSQCHDILILKYWVNVSVTTTQTAIKYTFKKYNLDDAAGSNWTISTSDILKTDNSRCEMKSGFLEFILSLTTSRRSKHSDWKKILFYK